MLLILLSQHEGVFDLISFLETMPGILLASALKRDENISHFCTVSHIAKKAQHLRVAPSLRNRKYAKKHYQQERGSQALKHD